MTFIEHLSALASAATAIGVGVTAYQLFIARQQAMTSFEDSLNTQYRRVIECLPVEALFGESLAEGEIRTLLTYFYRYFDLCNEQAFLHKHGRISDKTWHNWKEGIQTNMKRPAFAIAWIEVAARAKEDFEYLRTLSPPQNYEYKRITRGLE